MFILCSIFYGNGTSNNFIQTSFKTYRIKNDLKLNQLQVKPLSITWVTTLRGQMTVSVTVKLRHITATMLTANVTTAEHGGPTVSSPKSECQKFSNVCNFPPTIPYAFLEKAARCDQLTHSPTAEQVLHAPLIHNRRPLSHTVVPYSAIQVRSRDGHRVRMTYYINYHFAYHLAT